MPARKSQAWDVDKPCTFTIWNRRLEKRARVIGYSLRQFCEYIGWDWSEIVGSWKSNVCEPKGITWFEAGNPNPLQPPETIPELGKE